MFNQNEQKHGHPWDFSIYNRPCLWSEQRIQQPLLLLSKCRSCFQHPPPGLSFLRTLRSLVLNDSQCHFPKDLPPEPSPSFTAGIILPKQGSFSWDLF